MVRRPANLSVGKMVNNSPPTNSPVKTVNRTRILPASNKDSRGSKENKDRAVWVLDLKHSRPATTRKIRRVNKVKTGKVKTVPKHKVKPKVKRKRRDKDKARARASLRRIRAVSSRMVHRARGILSSRARMDEPAGLETRAGDKTFSTPGATKLGVIMAGAVMETTVR